MHTVSEYADTKETVTRPQLWEGFLVHLHYNKKIEGGEDKFHEELKKCWKTVNKLYMREVNEAKFKKRALNQENVWQELLGCHFIEFPQVCQFVQIMLASSGNTSPLERGYTHLQMIASKRRNKIDPSNLETLFLLATLNFPVKKPNEYQREIERLSTKTE